MKILIDARPLQTYSRFRGIGRYVNSLVELFKNNPEFYFLFFRGDDIDPRPKNRIIISSPRKGITFTDRFYLPPLLKKNKIDVYHSTAYALPKKMENLKFILTIYDITPLLFPRFSTIKNRMIFNRILVSGSRADQVIAISKNTKKDLMRVTDIPEDMIQVIYPGLQLTDPDIAGANFQMEGLPEEFVLYAGGFDGNKNVNTIVKALNIFRKPLVLTGLISERIQRELTELLAPGMKDILFFTGYVSDTDLSALYRKARLFLFPSIYEGFGFPPLEALNMGTPSIVSASGSLEEVLRDGALYLEDPMDENELAEKTISLWNDKTKRDELVGRGIKILSRYSSSKLKENMTDLYQSIHKFQV